MSSLYSLEQKTISSLNFGVKSSIIEHNFFYQEAAHTLLYEYSFLLTFEYQSLYITLIVPFKKNSHIPSPRIILLSTSYLYRHIWSNSKYKVPEL